MSRRAVIRYATWALRPDRTPGALTLVYMMECMTRLDTSETSNAPQDPEDWAIRHTARQHDHEKFRALVSSFVRVTPAPGNPLYEKPASR
ncbi:DUF7848 domain-containing protein [Streptomyces melanogenes]|uniref:DUF7848 domain-containing protein n=1 Tax=Streptomyces melanogenes TaxID=67326 RepID=UPI00167DE488|nr:hypothetical protein [Streptomyces melanogenes]GGP86026.1 hypothetical protein GCM10010278_75600 [Streptomyces melanogenes]